MINVRIGEPLDRDGWTFTFDDGFVVSKPKYPPHPAESIKNHAAEYAYQCVKAYREAKRDWLYHKRGKFGVEERRFENVLFRITK